ncbi:MAG: DUF1749 domain-containing protein, partial [Candidatus Aenigmatarchaeota archaeon]
SLGPSKIAYYLANNEHLSVDGVIFISPSEMHGLVLDESCPEHDRLIEEAQELVSQGKGDELLSEPLWGWARLSAETYLNFFGEDSNTDIFNYSTLERGFGTVEQIDVPVLAFLGTEDDGIVKDAEDAMNMLEEHASNCPHFEGIVFEGAEHDYSGFEDEIVKMVISFISTVDREK